MSKIKTNIDWSWKTDNQEPAIGLCKGELIKDDGDGSECKITRRYLLSKNGDLFTRLRYYYDGKLIYEDHNTYDFDEVFSENPKGWIRANHEADPEVEFEDFEIKEKTEVSDE